jgi:hypothetical protein
MTEVVYYGAYALFVLLLAECLLWAIHKDLVVAGREKAVKIVSKIISATTYLLICDIFVTVIVYIMFLNY